MDATVRQRLESLKHRRTTYEVVLVVNGQAFLLGYTSRCSLRGMLDLCRAKVAAIHAAAGYAADDVVEAKVVGKGRAAYLALNKPGVTVRFTGRTARDAILAGELPRAAAK